MQLVLYLSIQLTAHWQLWWYTPCRLHLCSLYCLWVWGLYSSVQAYILTQPYCLTTIGSIISIKLSFYLHHSVLSSCTFLKSVSGLQWFISSSHRKIRIWKISFLTWICLEPKLKNTKIWWNTSSKSTLPLK